MMMTPNLSIVIPALNSQEQAKEITTALAEQIENNFIEIILIDDGSIQPIDFTLEIENQSVFKILRHKENKGRSAAINTGIKESSGEYICFLDVDCIPDVDFISEMTKSIKAGYEIVFGHLVFESTHFFGKFENEVQSKRQQNTKDWAYELTSACVAIRRDLVETINGFNEEFNKYGFEDRDFFLRLVQKNKNIKPLYNAKAFVTHRDNVDLRQYLNKFESSAKFSSVIFYKYHPEIYRKMPYFTVDWRFNPRIHWIPKSVLYVFIPLLQGVVESLFFIAKSYYFKKQYFKLLKGLSYLKGTLLNDGDD